MSRLWDKGAPLDERVLRYTAGEDHALDDRLVAYDVRPRSPMPGCCTTPGSWPTRTSRRSRRACARSPPRTRAASGE